MHNYSADLLCDHFKEIDAKFSADFEALLDLPWGVADFDILAALLEEFSDKEGGGCGAITCEAVGGVD
jgi:hypothetical protein